jgi:hypothetical protein
MHTARRPVRHARPTGDRWWRAFSVITLLGGVWLVASPSAIEPSVGAAAVWNGVAAGAAVAVAATIRLTGRWTGAALSLATVAIGAWLIMSPLVYGYALWVGSRLAWSDLAIGIIISSVGLASFALGVDDG